MKLDDARIVRIAKAAKEGKARALQAKAGGVSRRTLQQWLANGQPDEDGNAPDDVYGKLAAAVESAEAEYEHTLVELVEKAAKSGKPGTWQAAMTLLERRNPGDWGRIDRSKVELTGKDGGAVEVDITNARERLLAGIDRLAARGGQDDDG